MKSKVYIETTIVSYLVASPTRDLIQSAHQEITRQWWTERRGDTRAAARRVAALLRSGTLPEKARVDALHVGVAKRTLRRTAQNIRRPIKATAPTALS